MKSVWKYTLEITDRPQKFAIPGDCRVLAVAEQGGLPTLWVEVEPEGREYARSFIVHGTGHPIDHSGQYRGTAFCDPFVWHVYEETP